MEKRTLVAILLCIGVWLVWQQFFLEPPKPKNANSPQPPVTKQQGDPAVKTANPATGEQTVSQPQPPAERPEEQLVKLDSGLFEAVFTSRGASLKNLKLFEFKERDENKSKEELDQEDLVSSSAENALPFRIQFESEKTSFKLPIYTDWQVVEATKELVKFRYAHPTDLNVPVVTKTFSIQKQPYLLDLRIQIQNRTEKSITEQVQLQMFASYQKPVKAGGCGGAPTALRSPLCFTGETLLPESSGCGTSQAMKPGESLLGNTQSLWAGINEQYFLLTAVAMGVDQAICKMEARHDGLMVTSLMYPDVVIPPGGQIQHDYRLFAGPKQLMLLEQVQSDFGGNKHDAKLTASVDFGWFGILCHPLLWLLKNFYSVIGNWGLAIILLTIVIKVLLLPLTQKSMKSMRDMARLKPLMEELKKKHEGDQQRLQQETMALYKAHKINPLGGCFPMLLQMPFWIALYRMLFSAVELYQAPFIPGWLEDLSYRDPYFILPVILGASMFLQQKLSPTAADSQQAKMMLYMMPVFFTFIMLYLPVGLVLYIFVSNVLSIGHQLLYNRLTNPQPATPTGNKAASDQAR